MSDPYRKNAVPNQSPIEGLRDDRCVSCGEVYLRLPSDPVMVKCRQCLAIEADAYEQGRADARAKCADLTSDLVRVLLAVEWSGEDGLRCPWCNGHQPQRVRWMDYEPGHASDCALDAALKRAGAR